jgi:hypothetical protein
LFLSRCNWLGIKLFPKLDIQDIADNLHKTFHLLGKYPCGKMMSKRPSGQMSFWANVFLGKRPSGQMSSGQMSFWANVFLGKCLLCLLGKCRSGQMSFWANVFWANVFWANVVLGKCRSGQMSLGKRRMGKCRVTLCSIKDNSSRNKKA